MLRKVRNVHAMHRHVDLHRAFGGQRRVPVQREGEERGVELRGVLAVALELAGGGVPAVDRVWYQKYHPGLAGIGKEQDTELSRAQVRLLSAMSGREGRTVFVGVDIVRIVELPISADILTALWLKMATSLVVAKTQQIRICKA